MNDQGDIVGLASENIGLWQPQTGYYVIPPCPLSRSMQRALEENRQLNRVGAIYERHLALHLLVGPQSH
jgi:hypothetical protein